MGKKKSLGARDVTLPIKDFTGAAAYSKVIAWYQDTTDTVKLSPQEEELRDRMDFCDNLIRKFGARSIVCPMLIRKYGFGKKRAYEIYNHTQLAFGSRSREGKEYWRDVITDMASQTREMALLKGNLPVATECLKIIVKVRRLDKEEVEEEPVGVMPQTVIINYQQNNLGLVQLSDDEAQALLAEVLKPKAKQNYAEEIDHVETSATRSPGE